MAQGKETPDKREEAELTELVGFGSGQLGSQHTAALASGSAAGSSEEEQIWGIDSQCWI
jgi:hypothetical protein